MKFANNYKFRIVNLQMVFKASEVQRRLEKLGCFRNVGIVIDTSKGENASQDGYEVRQF